MSNALGKFSETSSLRQIPEDNSIWTPKLSQLFMYVRFMSNAPGKFSETSLLRQIPEDKSIWTLKVSQAFRTQKTFGSFQTI